MTKNCLLAVALVSLALAAGCAKGGNGIVPPPIVISVTTPSGINALAIYATQSLTITATVTNSTTTAVTWALSGTGLTCTGSPNPCGTLTPASPATTPATATYVAPATPTPKGSAVTITATLVADTTKTGTLAMNIVPVTVFVTPTTVNIGAGLVQQFTAVGVPDGSPQTFTWSCTPTTGSCGSLVQDPNFSGLAVYTAPASGTVTISATWENPPPSSVVGQAAVKVVPSRLPSGAYAFRFSGYDSSTPPKPVSLAGSFTVGAGGLISSGVEDVLIGGIYHQYTVSGSYVPIGGNDNSNNLGTLKLIASGGPTYVFTTVLSSDFPVFNSSGVTRSGVMRMIESDAVGTGSGVLQQSAANTFKNPQTFVFGFTGVDTAGKRVGYAGLLPMNGLGGIVGGLLDVNDGGNASICGTPPCSVTGTYTVAANDLSGTMALTFGAMTLNFDFFVAGGQTTNQPNPLTLYAISTDATYQSLSGAMEYQFPLKTSTCAAPCYNNAAFNGTSVSNLTGANANVSLTLGTTDGTSSGTGGTGGFFGQFDQNNNGTILSAASFPAASQTTSPYTYVATNNTGRYIFNMMGDPTQTTPVPPIPFVLYASGANRGFLLDQSSAAVMTGRMDPQPAKAFYAPSEMPGTYAAATIGNTDSSTVPPVVQNLLLTSDSFPNPPVYSVTGTQNPGNVALAGTYIIQGGFSPFPGVGTIALTNVAPPAGTSVIYAIDIDKTTQSVLDFMMMGTCTPVAPATTCTSGPPSSIMFAQQ